MLSRRTYVNGARFDWVQYDDETQELVLGYGPEWQWDSFLHRGVSVNHWYAILAGWITSIDRIRHPGELI